MYKLLLCWRYLRTRYIALICIVSVTLGVATMIVVNSVMAGFTHEMQSRLNGMLGDLVIDCRSMDGAPDAAAHMQTIRRTVGDDVVGMSPTVNVPALLYFDVYGANGKRQSVTRQITLVGIDKSTYADVSEFGNYLQHPKNRDQLDFQLRENGYDTIDHMAEDMSKVQPRKQMKSAGWGYRRYKSMIEKQHAAEAATKQPKAGDEKAEVNEPFDPFKAQAEANGEAQGQEFDSAKEQHTGIVLGIGICGMRLANGSDHFLALPGDDVKISFPTASMPPKAISERYTIVDFYESKMNEYDSNFVFVPIRSLQESRGLVDPTTGVGKFTSIQIKLKPGADANAIRDKLKSAFPQEFYMVSTWRDKQGPLLAAVQMETAVLNVLLFMIIAVAGFGILAIFYMIVVEKTRDIGILKSLGASGRGVMGIFLTYGFSLGLVGAGAGFVIGWLFVRYINEIADGLGRLTGQPVFDPSVYYFYKIPTIVQPFTVAWILAGAVLIAVMASILPARRAARLHPVRALRYE
ncbi:ABC transporter permease [Adhaeretor mobilis]|uniref:Lipoprotein-releasing system transmembrane protein LolE n=1 Tax=Adhaeretor mobilis TaxID=1930276 RepID=A0A517MTA8_9BACT|nr:FtsX-like permease family protein [Adhaeretor mobilis]QDS98113.1 Lipoprotein-releasing system transmembrane protein LolE [Adhaeretor mobilis]